MDLETKNFKLHVSRPKGAGDTALFWYLCIYAYDTT